ncbi:glycolate oxidase subunit GlcE [Verminephrobacter eiseniae]|uniref:FAD linked oxidase domain protein n=1 Tax=Verminephrobacter eiseniae (strain EF01-2) TaxID=391735 RepID=A1WN35_VEREI|nr:glycolate oxidase subunit GlcE [Verminephrobacter eiseniae]ABM59042.1 FAD linked oxidase domain protein [Verminephrobacter eiseniae EF01-2]MCW5284597.1 glycolate oxidase subunit GlcE [Verminephrobacter eiseniae]MCW5302303.1 glycolate oxidase subunit GlcE [Verminephrobacter eiseniae]MCW8179625.1 glycolate oxidase subunit GlcE [Verminephrobacter eiseniae]MCW8191366.1 glycolate oxidase subunit GlcE [Verminephrobacter eiseniae]
MDSLVATMVEQVRAAVADRTPLRIRGGGSKDFHGLALHGQLLDTRMLRGIVSYAPSELVVTVRAGTPLAELEAALAEQGQCLPFEPPHFARGATDSATVGGMVAAGLSGPARARAGAVRDYLLGVTLLNGRAELLRFGGQVMKNVAGYDVSRLMVGAWGTLGLLTELSLKVLPVAPGEATLRFECSQAEALRKLHAWGGQPLALDASCWLQDDEGQGRLYVRLRGAVAAVESACKTMGGTRIDNASAAADWAACREQTLPWFSARAAHPELALWRLSLPATAPVMPLPGQPLLEWHGALRWLQAPESAGAALRAAARAAGGNASIFIAASADRSGASGHGASGQFDWPSTALEQIHARLKHSFDPSGIFNPGRMVRDW